MRDELPTEILTNVCRILNLNNSNQEGSHWVEWIKHENLNIYFESYDYANPPKELRVKDDDALFTLASTSATIPAVGKVIIEDFKITTPPVEYQEMYKIKLIKELTKLSQGNNYRLNFKSWQCMDENNLSGKTFKRNM
ncbi:Hypothetical protein CINCED_3A020064 [Cinara cedri]|uniref:Uncharacterized protein n=1 Tax=Cinara cedri TaxID=506608 RepID=A0A5E4N2L8_9HEMI|nr:Hypothetical protein CINCED_3A020064 [Cinara cedri]